MSVPSTWRSWLALSAVGLGVFAATTLACSEAAPPAGSGGALGSGGNASDSGGSATGGASGGAVGTGGEAYGGGSDQGLVDFLGHAPDPTLPAATFEEVGMDGAPIAAGIEAIEAADWEIHSFLVMRRGKLVVEQYGWDSGTNPAVPGEPHQILPDERHPLFSTTKSILSALYGIALDQGAIEDLGRTAASFFPDYAELSPSPEKDTITLEHLLTMQSGLEWEEGDQTTFEAPDPARAAFSRPVVTTPGGAWNYSSGNSDILAEILHTSTGDTPLEFATVELFAPLGIEDPPWEAGKNGVQYGGWGLSLSSREMARFGEMYRNAGQWQGTQVVPASWTDTSIEPRTPTAWGGQYAYHFWVPDLPGFFNTLGAFGQVIYVSRSFELIVVFTAHLPSETADTIFRQLISTYVIPAISEP